MNTASKHTTGVQDALAVYAEAISALQRDDRCIAAIAAMTGDIIDCIGQGGKVLLCGNGGFAAVCQHVAAELMGKIDAKRPPIAAVSLATDMSVITCIANDFGYEQTFARQIEALGRPGDIVICLSASGRSKNILEAMSTAARLGINRGPRTARRHRDMPLGIRAFQKHTRSNVDCRTPRHKMLALWFPRHIARRRAESVSHTNAFRLDRHASRPDDDGPAQSVPNG